MSLKIIGGALLLALLAGCSGEQSSAANTASAMQEPPAAIADVFNRSCRSCHVSGAGGAPRVGDRAAWDPRVFQGLDALLDHTISGFKGMPPMGMCMDCDEDQFVELIEYMAGQTLE